jgi:nucleotide-binding universal stress UspA family protein
VPESQDAVPNRGAPKRQAAATLVDATHGAHKPSPEKPVMVSMVMSTPADVDRWYTQLKARGVAAEGYLASGNTIEQIIAFARRLTIDLIVLGHYPQPSGGFWWGSAQRTSLAERANCCIFVAVNEPDSSDRLPGAA